MKDVIEFIRRFRKCWDQAWEDTITAKTGINPDGTIRSQWRYRQYLKTGK